MQNVASVPRRRAGLISPAALRSWHAGISAFIAPMVLFFSISGALQIFQFHEAHGAYHPSALLATMGQIHKKETLAVPPPRAQQPRDGGLERPRGSEESRPPTGGSAPPPNLPLKILFFWESIALFVTTLIGVWIGVTHAKYGRRTWIFMAAGAVIPAVLLLV